VRRRIFGVRATREAIIAGAKNAAGLRLVKPDLAMLPEYIAALERGWSPDNTREAEAAAEELVRIREDPAGFVELLDDPEAKGGPITLPDGSVVPRLPGFRRWLWDGSFCGSIGFRWQKGTPDLPAYVLGHIGYAVVPWKRGRGYAKRALAMLLPEVRATGLGHVELIADPGNIASQAVILANGGHLVERFTEPASYGGREALRFRIALRQGPA
jgi:predicted acetyltransferase